MKKIIYTVALLSLVGTELKAQPAAGAAASADWRVGGNTANGLNVIGTWWNVGAGAPPQMWFTTGAAAPQYRMAIFGGGVGPNDGQIAMSNNLPGGFVPTARLHLHQTVAGAANFMRYTSGATGATATDGFTMGMTGGGFASFTNFELSQPIAFLTNNGAAGGIFERMRIQAFSGNGFIGMGNSAAFVPRSQLHINTIGANLAAAAVGGEVFRTEGLNALDNSWRLLTGPAIGSTTQKGRIFASPTGTTHAIGVIYPAEEYFNLDASQADMVFFANGTRPIGSVQQERMRITSEDNFNGTGVDVTRVGITRDVSGTVADPRAMLHIGHPFTGPANSRGHRFWMDVGTYYSSANTDMMYVGHHNLALQQNNAIIAFGSEPVNFNNPAAPGDRMMFRFINDPGFGNQASGPDGLEIARMVSDGNNGRMSVGNPVGPIDPGNTLEIISSAGSPQPAGLRFRNLTCTSPTVPLCNPLNPVYLSVDANGDVILVNGTTGGGGCCLGNLCGGVSNPLPGDWEIPMNNANFNFTDPAGTLPDGRNFVRIGGSTCSVPRAKLDVFRDFTNNALPTVIGAYHENRDMAMSSPFSGTAYATYSVANGQNSVNYGVYGESMNGSSNIGLHGNASDFFSGGPNAFQNVGVQGNAQDAMNNHGVIGMAVSNNSNTSSNMAGLFRAGASPFNMNSNIGVYSAAGNNNTSTGTDNIGVLSYAFNSGTYTNNVGVAGISQNFGTATNDIGIYGEGGISGYFTGAVLTSQPVIVFSDNKIKSNVQTIENGTEILKKLNPVTYNYKSSEYPELHLSNQLQYGFIAQEVEQVLPELVMESKKPEFKDKDGKIISKGGEYKGVNYDGIIPVLTKSMQEQVSEIEALKKELAELKEIMKASGGQSTGSNNISNVDLSDHAAIVLDQNVPNPFAEQTVINYILTDDVQRAQMLFYNADGKLINSVELTGRGKGQLNVFANDLSNGIYTYTLVVDGKIVDSKRMVKNK